MQNFKIKDSEAEDERSLRKKCHHRIKNNLFVRNRIEEGSVNCSHFRKFEVPVTDND